MPSDYLDFDIQTALFFWKNNTVIAEKLQNQSIDVYMKKLSQNGAK